MFLYLMRVSLSDEDIDIDSFELRILHASLKSYPLAASN